MRVVGSGDGPATLKVGMSGWNATERVADIKGNVCATRDNLLGIYRVPYSMTQH